MLYRQKLKPHTTWSVPLGDSCRWNFADSRLKIGSDSGRRAGIRLLFATVIQYI